MSRAPAISPSVAAAVLALVDFAKAVEPLEPLGYIRGYCVARSHDPIEPDPRAEPVSHPVARIKMGGR